jgi:hypothetical protein
MNQASIDGPVKAVVSGNSTPVGANPQAPTDSFAIALEVLTPSISMAQAFRFDLRQRY